MSNENWRAPPLVEATLRLNKLLLELQKHKLEAKLKSLHKLLLNQIAQAANGKLDNAPTEPTVSDGTTPSK